MNFTSPCSTCIVQACCTVYCNDYFKYVNQIIDNLWKMTNEQMNEFETSNPLYLRNIIHKMYNNNNRFIISNKVVPRAIIARR